LFCVECLVLGLGILRDKQLVVGFRAQALEHGSQALDSAKGCRSLMVSMGGSKQKQSFFGNGSPTKEDKRVVAKDANRHLHVCCLGASKVMGL